MVRRLAIVLLFLFVGGCTGGFTPVPGSDKTIHVAADMPAQTKQTLLADTKIWMEKYFTDDAEPILYHDPSEGVIVGSGQVDYPCSWLVCTTKGHWRVSFEMHVRMQVSEIETVFRNLQIISPSPDGHTGMVGPVWSQRDMDAIRPKLLERHQDLMRYLNRGQ